MVSLPKLHLESEFQLFLGTQQTDRKKFADFPRIAARVWEAKHRNSERGVKKLRSELDEEKRLKSNLLRLRTKDEISREEFEGANAALREKIFGIEDKLRALELARTAVDSFVHFAELQVTDLAHVWQIASPLQRERVQNLLFERGFRLFAGNRLFEPLEVIAFQ